MGFVQDILIIYFLDSLKYNILLLLRCVRHDPDCFLLLCVAHNCYALVLLLYSYPFDQNFGSSMEHLIHKDSNYLSFGYCRDYGDYNLPHGHYDYDNCYLCDVGCIHLLSDDCCNLFGCFQSYLDFD